MKVEKIPEPNDMNGERYFQIRDVDKNGYGSFENFCVSSDSTDQEIREIACKTWTERMEYREKMYYPSFFRQPPKWRDSIWVVEQIRKILPPSQRAKDREKSFENEWSTKRKGTKFKIKRSYLIMKFKDGTISKIQGYKADYNPTPLITE